MSKFSKVKRLAKVLFRNPALLNIILEQNSAYDHHAKNLGFEDGLPVIDILDLSTDFDETIEYYSLLDGGSLISDLALIKKITKKYFEANYFEIGTWRGESVANVSGLAKECYTLNLPTTELQSLGLSEKYIGQQDFFSKKINGITHLKGNSMNFDFSPYYQKNDVVFIDGDHHFDSVKKDTETAFKLIKNETSTIIWHDYGYSPEKIRYELMCAIIEGTPKKYRENLFHVSNTMCAIFTTKDYPVYWLKDKLLPSVSFTINIKANKILSKQKKSFFAKK